MFECARTGVLLDVKGSSSLDTTREKSPEARGVSMMEEEEGREISVDLPLEGVCCPDVLMLAIFGRLAEAPSEVVLDAKPELLVEGVIPAFKLLLREPALAVPTAALAPPWLLLAPAPMTTTLAKFMSDMALMT